MGLTADVSLMLQNEICANLAENFLKNVDFSKICLVPIRTIFLHRMGFWGNFSGAPVRGGARKCVTNLCFLGLFPFVLILLAAYLHDGWWRGCTRTTRRTNKKQTAINDSNYWFCSFCVFSFCVVLFQRFCFFLHAHGFLVLLSFPSFIIINTIALFYMS